MSDTALRARTASEIVDAGFRLYTRHASQYILITALAYTPMLVLNLAFGTMRASATPSMTFVLLTVTLSIITFALMTATVTALGARSYLGEPVDAAAAIREALPRIPIIILNSLVMVGIYMVGILCFIVGVFYVWTRFFAVAPAIVLEKKGVFSAISRSSKLTSGRMGHTFGSLLLVWALYLAGSIGAGIISAFLQNFVLITLVTTLYTIVAFPIIALSTMVLYYDLRIRNEGFDLERMTQGLGEPMASPAAPTYI